MEIQEAIEQLKYAKGIIEQNGKDYLDERDIPVLDMAIEALEKQNIQYDTESWRMPVNIKITKISRYRKK